MRLFIGVIIAATVVSLSVYAYQQHRLTLMKQKIGQKIMLDLRYYCADMTGNNSADEIPCITPLTTLPPELAQMITDTSLGSVILFADNLQNQQQITQLTHDLQRAANASAVGTPLFISVDQEGGRVVRLPRDMATSFTGNMALGATYYRHGTKYAKDVGEVFGRELTSLGFNINHAPTVDVNINPDNPVINVRSFGDNPEIVGELGIAMLEGMQSEGLIATLKHFPGHGDTHTDSHTGLPRVEHDLETIKEVDLKPFKMAIDTNQVEMIMTAHIQYPALDSTTLVNKHGDSMLKPATLSRAILSELLREQMQYQGVIITDALDMAGISDFFEPFEAVMATFDAGADIAMMPMRIEKPSDIQKFEKFIEALAKAALSGKLDGEKIDQSVARISGLKQKYVIKQSQNKSTALASEQHLALQKSIAEQSLVEIKKDTGSNQESELINRVHVLFPKEIQAQAMANSLLTAVAQLPNLDWQVTYTSFDNQQQVENFASIDDADMVIIASDNQASAVELGGVIDIEHQQSSESSQQTIGEKALSALTYAKAHGKKTVYVPLNLPYYLAPYSEQADRILATFDGKAYRLTTSNFAVSPAFEALSLVITNQQDAPGTMPITQLN